MSNQSPAGCPVVGDVIISKKFAFGSKEGGEIYVDGKTKKRPVIENVGEKERLKIAAKTGRIPPENRKVDYGAFDKSRATAEFVVEEARMTGGQESRGASGGYPDGYHVWARRLDKDGKYDLKGERIHFTMSGPYISNIEASDVKIVRKMKKIFI